MLPSLRSLLLIATWSNHQRELSWNRVYFNALAWFGPEDLEKRLRLQIVDDNSHAVTAVMGRTAGNEAVVFCGSAGHQGTLSISGFVPARIHV
jgi:hypothetical protein